MKGRGDILETELNWCARCLMPFASNLRTGYDSMLCSAALNVVPARAVAKVFECGAATDGGVG